MILTGAWTTTIQQMGMMQKRAVEAVDLAVREEAHYFHKKVIEAFRKQGARHKWRPLNPITIALRAAGHRGGASGGTKALTRTGALRRSVKVHRRAWAQYFVGVHRTSDQINVAQLHETGLVVIPITEKMRTYFRALFWKGIIPFPWPSSKKKYIVIHRRSFLQDTYDVESPMSATRIKAFYSKHVFGAVTGLVSKGRSRYFQ